MFKKYAEIVVKFRWVIIVVWLILVPVLSKTLPSLTSVTTSSNSAFLPASSPSQHASNLTTTFEGKNTATTSTIVAASSSGPLSSEDKQAITDLEAKVKRLPTISIVKTQALSSDGQVQEIQVGTTSSGFSTAAEDFVTSVRGQFSKVNAPSGLSFHLTGPLAEGVDENNSNNKSRNDTQIFILLFIVVLLFIVYRSLLAPLITLLPAGLSLAIASPVIAESTKIGVQVSPITQLLLIVLLLGAGTDYGIFLVFRVKEELRKGLEPKDAVIEALSHVGKVITFSALTVSAALISLLLASFGFYKGLGPSLAIGMGILLLSGLTLLPALITVFGRAVFWPVKNKKEKEPKIGLWGRVAERVVAHPVITLSFGTILLLALCAGLIGYKTGGFNDSGAPAKSDSSIGQSLVLAHFPAANNNPQEIIFKFSTSVWNDPTVITNAESELSTKPVFKSIEGASNANGGNLTATQLSALHKQLGNPANLPEIPSSTTVPPKLYLAYLASSQFISSDGKTIQFFGLLKAGASGTTAAANSVPSARSAVTQVATDVHATDSGLLSQDAFIYDISHISSSDLSKIVPVVLVVIALLLAILLRSLVAPWYLIITVGLSYLATLGFANLVFVRLSHGTVTLSFFLPFLLFIFSMALGEDYNILVMSRIREEAHGNVTIKGAITRAIGITGTTVTSAGLILAGTFAVLGIAGGQQEVQQIGFSIAFGILLDTFFVRTLFVPSIAVLLGKWNWWPSKLYKRDI